MAISFKWPWIGVAIPVCIIAGEHILTTFLMIKDSKQGDRIFTIFQGCLFMVWLSYYLAIKTSPGNPPVNYKVKSLGDPQGFWYKYCPKCRADKPERTHHCKTCGRCILKMDHHCPWTMNCIGYRNMPHFVRFLFWVLISGATGLWYHWGRLHHYWKIRNLPSYLISRTDLVMTIVCTLLLLFIEFTLLLLFMRTIDGLSKNVSTIEDWEQDRMHHVFYREAFWLKVRANFAKLHHGESFPELTSWKINYRELPKKSSVPLNFTFEDLVFPYDLGSSYENMKQSLGPFYQWLWPWGGPDRDGLSFPKTWWKEEDQLKLPFPIDGGDYQPLEGKETLVSIEDEPDTTLGNFPNELGETLDNFGVDMGTENYITRKNK